MFVCGLLGWRAMIVGISLFHLYPATSASSLNPPIGQKPLFATVNEVHGYNYSIGFSLQSSFGAAAAIIDRFDGQTATVARVFHGGAEYERVMTRLSLETSRHIAPPYDDDGQFWADQPRKAVREALKAAQLPASYEVLILAQVIQRLSSEIESTLGIEIQEAVFAASHLVALYQDDIQDAAAYSGIKYVIPKGLHDPFVWETAAAYAGHGFGLCKHWQDDDACADEGKQMPSETILAVHYSRTALTVSLTVISQALWAWEQDYRRVENFTLGSDSIKSYPNREDYWTDVKDTILSINTQFPLFPKPGKVLVTGDLDGGDFIDFLRSTMEEYLGTAPHFLTNDTTTAAAKGAAQFMRRRPAAWSP
ncbi:hypothetical protein JX266_010337 [Neoarthrinium moseri]|nr:hypothetical protein JX266_010337 [Neoarthrinium moseri]